MSNSPAILVTGGAGYIGSHACRALQAAGYQPVVYDNLSTGHKGFVTGPLVVGDLLNKAVLVRTFAQHNIQAVMHFAAASLVGESMTDPQKYYINNVSGTLSLLDAMRDHGFVMDPTFSIYEANRDVARAQNLPWHGEYTLPAVMNSFLPSPSHHASYFFEWTSNKEADWARAYRLWMDFVNDYKNQGGIVAVGSDSGFLFSVWGFGTIRELELLEEAGFSPLETIHAATENGAKALRNPQLGLIRPGYLADMVVLTENPLVDVKILYGSGVTRATKDGKQSQEHCVKYTIRDGVVFDSQALLAEVREMVAKAKQAKAAGKN